MTDSQSRLKDEEISLKELLKQIKGWWKYLLSKWVVIFSVGILGGIAGFTYAYFSKPKYMATITFVLEEGSGGGMGQYAGLASMVGVDLGSGTSGLFSGDNIIELYKSRSMIQKSLLSPVIIAGKQELLIDRYLKMSKTREKWKNDPSLKNISFADSSNMVFKKDSILSVVVKAISSSHLNVFKPDKKLSIIKVVVTSKDELFSKYFAEQLVKTVSNFYVQTKTKKTSENVAILQYQTDSVRKVMNSAIYSSAATLDATPNINPARQLLRAPVQRSQFNAEANKTVLAELIKNLELSKITLRKETPLIQVIDSPILPLEIDKPGKKKFLILGCFVFGIIASIYLIARKEMRN